MLCFTKRSSIISCCVAASWVFTVMCEFSAAQDPAKPAQAVERLDGLHSRLSQIVEACGYSQSWLRDIENNRSRRGELSWRVHLLPRLGYPDLYERFRFDQSWDSEHNRALLDRMPDVFQSGDGDRRTRIRFVRRSESDMPDVRSTGQHPDGDEQTIAFYLGSSDEAVPWTQPEPILTSDSLAQFTQRQAKTPTVIATARGDVYACPQGLHPQKWAALISSNRFEHVSMSRWMATPQEAGKSPLPGFLGAKIDATWPTDEQLSERADLNLAKIAAALDKLSIPRNSQLSWRVHLLPALGHQSLYEQFRLDEAWDSDHNYALIDRMPAEFQLHPVAGRTAWMAVDRVLKTYIQGSPWKRASESKVAVYLSDHLETWTRPSSTPWTVMTDDLASSSIHAALCDGKAVVIPANTSREKRIALIEPSDPAVMIEERWFGPYADLGVPREDDAGQVLGPIYLPDVPPPVPLSEEASESYYYSMNAAGNHFATVFNGLLNYNRRHRRFPDTAISEREKNIHLSWRVHILPFIGQQELYDRFDLRQPWDSERNRALLHEMPDLFRLEGDAPDATTTRMCLYLAPETVFDGVSKEINLNYNRIRDSLRGIIIGGEVGQDKAVPWTKPEDLEVDIHNFIESLGEIGDSVTLFALHSNTLRVPTSLPPAIFRSMLTRDGGEMVDLDRVERWAAQHERMPYVYQLFAIDMHARSINRMHFVAQQFLDKGTPVPKPVDNRKLKKKYFPKHLSWRVHLLRYLDYQDLHRQFRFHEPWDSPHNSQLIEFMPDVFRDATAPHDSVKTRLVALVGQDAAVDPMTMALDPARIKDDRGNTILFVQAPPEKAVVWTRPDDLKFDADDPLACVGPIPEGGLLVTFANGTTNFLVPEIDAKSFKALATRDGGERINASDFFKYKQQ